MNETATKVNPRTHCVRCSAELSHIEKSNCMRCLVCYPESKNQATHPKEKKIYLDMKLTEERVVEMFEEVFAEGAITHVSLKRTRPETIRARISMEKIREIVRDELENWHIQKPPATRDEIDNSTNNADIPVEPKQETWRQKAKRMGVKTHNDYSGGARKKVDVLRDMERIENGRVGDTKDQPEN